jgi:hypothetical protein
MDACETAVSVCMATLPDGSDAQNTCIAAANADACGVDPNELCNVELCIDNATFKQVCIDEINDCIDAGGRTTEECVAFGTETCTV